MNWMNSDDSVMIWKFWKQGEVMSILIRYNVHKITNQIRQHRFTWTLQMGSSKWSPTLGQDAPLWDQVGHLQGRIHRPMLRQVPRQTQKLRSRLRPFATPNLSRSTPAVLRLPGSLQSHGHHRPANAAHIAVHQNASSVLGQRVHCRQCPFSW